MAQVAAATLKLPIDVIDARLGDTRLPKAPVSGGSQSAASVCPAVQAAAKQAQLKLLTLAGSGAVIAIPWRVTGRSGFQGRQYLSQVETGRFDPLHETADGERQ